MSDLLELLVAFTRVGLFGFGGGPAMIPLIQVEVVDIHAWLSPAEFLDAFAFGNALPGPIATKLAGYVGYQVAGGPGAAVALLGITGPTIVLMIGLASFYARYRERRFLQDFLYGVRPVVVALLAVVVWDFAPGALAAFDGVLANGPLWLIALASLALSLRFDTHPALLIVAGGALGIALGLW
jgi:chromate transporter